MKQILLKQIAEIGVIVLMFTAGLETDLMELRQNGKSILYHCLIWRISSFNWWFFNCLTV